MRIRCQRPSFGVGSSRRPVNTVVESSGWRLKIPRQHHNNGHRQYSSANAAAQASTWQPCPNVDERTGNLTGGGNLRVWEAIKWAAAAACIAGLAVYFSTACSTSSALPLGLTNHPFAALSLAARGPASAEAVAAAVRSAWAGLAAGCLHTLAGADHLAALTPLTIGRSHLKASLLGALWGFGHSTGQLILGLLMVVLKDRFTALVPALSKWGGTTVGLTLLAIGALGVYEAFIEGHHDDEAHGADVPGDSSPSGREESSAAINSPAEAFASGVEVHVGAALAAGKEKRGFRLATFATGIVYGLQPDALFVIIPALALPTKMAAVAYILMFVLGTVAAMGAYTGVIGATSAAIKKSNSRLNQSLSGIAAFVAIAIGIAVLASGWGIALPWMPTEGLFH